MQPQMRLTTLCIDGRGQCALPPARNAGEQLVGMLMQIIDRRAAEDLQEVWKAKMVVRQSTDRISCNDST